MTLNLTIVGPHGIWQCSDHRLTDSATGKRFQNHSVKHVIFRSKDGGALLAYSGAGRVKHIDLSDWIRETLRGESRTLDQSFIALRENADKDLAALLKGLGIVHMFSIGAFIAGRAWCVQIRNFVPSSGAVLDHFETAAAEFSAEGQGFLFGDPAAVTPSDQRWLLKVAKRKPRKPSEFRKLLATINRRAAQTPAGRISVSPECVTTYMPPSIDPLEMQFHDASGNASKAALITPFLLLGVDLTELTKAVASLPLSPVSAEQQAEVSRRVEETSREAVVPRNRLRK
jgi:hypothetical protein